MDKQFWKAVQGNDYKVPEGHTVKSLTPELLSFLGSTDPELRDELAYAILVEWVEHDLYSPDDLRQIIASFLRKSGGWNWRNRNRLGFFTRFFHIDIGSNCVLRQQKIILKI